MLKASELKKLSDGELVLMMERGDDILQDIKELKGKEKEEKLLAKELKLIQKELEKRGMVIKREQHGEYSHVHMTFPLDYKKQQLKKWTLQELKSRLMTGVVLAKATKDSLIIQEDLTLMMDELKLRGEQAVITERDTELGKATSINFEPFDTKAHSEVKMDIPSPSELIKGKVATDLPKHGYLTDK